MRLPQLERCAELRSVTARLWEAWMRGDVESVVGRYSRSAEVSGFGTDPSEVFDDPDQVERYTRAEFAALNGPWPFGPAEIEAWSKERSGGRRCARSSSATGPPRSG